MKKRKYRQHKKEFKAAVAEEATAPGNSMTSVAKKYNLSAGLVNNWVKKWKNGEFGKVKFSGGLNGSQRPQEQTEDKPINPTLTLVIEWPSGTSSSDVIEEAKDLAVKAAQFGMIHTADLDGINKISLK